MKDICLRLGTNRIEEKQYDYQDDNEYAYYDKTNTLFHYNLTLEQIISFHTGITFISDDNMIEHLNT